MILTGRVSRTMDGRVNDLVSRACCQSCPYRSRLWSRDHVWDFLIKRRRGVFLYYPHPLVTFFDSVPSSLTGEGEDHLPRFAGLCHDRDYDDLVTDCIFARFYFFYGDKRDLLGGQDIFCTVKKDDPLVRQDPLERDRLDIDPLCPYEHVFIAVEF